MAIDTPSNQYDNMQGRWQTARDCVAGSHEIKKAGTTYLPALDGHNPRIATDHYWDYVKRALYYNASGRTVDGLVGMIFRRPPVVEAPDAADDLVDDIDMLGRSVEQFCRGLIREVLTTGRAGLLVDHTQPPAELRPYFRLYSAEDILDVQEDVIGGVCVPTLIRLAEAYEQRAQDGEDQYETETVEQVRVLILDDGIYRQEVHRLQGEENDSEGRKYLVVEESQPMIDGAPLDFIPFWVFSAETTQKPSMVSPPPLLDLFEVNLAHYRTEADYRNAIHMAGVPTLCISGSQTASNEGKVKVGSSEVFFLPEADAKAYYVSYGAEGAAAIRQSLDDLQQMMAMLGARMLQPDPKGIEAAETAAIHRMGEVSILASIAGSANIALTEAFKFLLEWALFPSVDDAEVSLNTDFIPTQAPPQLLAEMVKAWQAGAISHDSLWAFAQGGELVDPRRTADEERELIREEKAEEPPEPPAPTTFVQTEGPDGVTTTTSGEIPNDQQMAAQQVAAE